MDSLIKLLAVGVRVAAIFLFTNGLYLTFTTFWFQFANHSSEAWYMLLLGIIPLVISLLLWKYPLSIARFISPTETGGLAIKDLSRDESVASIMSVVGIALIAIAIPGLVEWTVYGIAVHQNHDVSFAKLFFTSNLFPGLLKAITQILIGFWLVVGNEKLAKWINRVRFAAPR